MKCNRLSSRGQWIVGMLRRVVIILCMHWRAHQPRPEHKSLTDFQAAMGEDNLAHAMLRP